MGKPTGFKEFKREVVPYRDPVELEAYAKTNDLLARLPDRQSHSRVE